MRRRAARVPAALLLPALLASTLLLAACGGGGGEALQEPPGADTEAPGGVRLVDVTGEAGLTFRHFNDASPRRLLPETMGAGAAFFDYDGDGWVDLYLVNGGELGEATGGRDAADGPHGALYRNLGDGRFADVTTRAGLAADGFYGMGAAVGDLDNDGDVDLFLSGVGGDRLWRNRGDGTFEEVAAAFGLRHPGFGSSAAFLDVDRDGWLDLFAGRYVTWSPAADVPCTPDGVSRAYCTPEVYPGESSRFYRNRGGQGLVEITAGAGLWRPGGKSLGVVPLDADGDGWEDLAVANDTARNFLFLNRRDGTFREVGVEAGMAYSESGATRGGMGIDAGDADGDGRTDLAIGNFAQEMAALYRGLPAPPDGIPYFVDDGAQVGIGLPTLMTLAFGTLLVDVDGDGDLDLLFANGHIEPDIAAIRRGQSYAQPLQLFLGDGRGSFEPVGGEGEGGSAGGAGQRDGGAGSDGAGSRGGTRVPDGAGGPEAVADPLGQHLVGRGLATADLDRDCDPDFAVTQNGRRARLLRNDSPRHHWLRLELAGTASNRTGYGATVRVTARLASGQLTLTRRLVSGRSYLSASEPALVVGLGTADRVERLEVDWPSGRRLVLVGLEVDHSYRLVEPGG